MYLVLRNMASFLAIFKESYQLVNLDMVILRHVSSLRVNEEFCIGHPVLIKLIIY